MRKCNLLFVGAVLLGILLIPLSCAARPLPFSFDQILSYFDNAFERPAHRVQDSTRVYIEGNAPDESIVMAISSRERKIVVTLITNGDWGVNYIREFFEASFFLRSESEQLYALLNAKPGARSATLGRFDVEIDVVETREWIIITAEFGPPGSYQFPLVRPEHVAQP